MTEKTYYVRIQGKVIGPLPVTQLKSLRERGQFRRFHEVSEDRQTWRPASSLKELFPVKRETATEEPEESEQPKVSGRERAAPPGGNWYYTDAAGKQAGPVPQEQLLTLWQSGGIHAKTLVWKEGLPDWLPISSPSLGLAQVLAARLPEPVLISTSSTSALGRFFSDPVGGLPGVCQALGPGWSAGLGLMLGLVFDFCVVFGALLDTSSFQRPNLRNPFADARPAPVLGVDPPLRHVQWMDADLPRDRLAFVLKLLGVALLPLASLALAIAIVRTVTRGEGSIGYDLLTAGTALVPVGLLMPAAALLGPANIEVVLFLSLVCLCLTVLVLNSAFTRIIRLSDRGAILAVPATLLITFWLSKVVVMSVVLG